MGRTELENISFRTHRIIEITLFLCCFWGSGKKGYMANNFYFGRVISSNWGIFCGTTVGQSKLRDKKSVYHDFGAIRIAHLEVMTLTKARPCKGVLNQNMRRWILFGIVIICILTTYFYHPAYNVPTCLAKVSESKVRPKERYNVDSPGFKTKLEVFITSPAPNFF